MKKTLLIFCLLARLSFAQDLTVAAAASLKPALDKIAAGYPDIKLTFTFGSSGTLQKQIENGAPIDVFLSAATSQVDALQKRKLIDPGSRRNFVKNQLVLIVRKDLDTVNSFEDLRKSAVRHLALGEFKSVPAGQYAEQTLKFMHLLETLKPKAVYGMDVRQVLTYVERGDAEAGLVYQSDAQSSDQVRVAATAPAESHEPILYCAAIVKESRHVPRAAEFIQYLTTPPAQKIFKELGFTTTGDSK